MDVQLDCGRAGSIRRHGRCFVFAVPLIGHENHLASSLTVQID